MPSMLSNAEGRRRGSSSSTVRAATPLKSALKFNDPFTASQSVEASFWVHDDQFSQEVILINPSILTSSSISEGSLVEIATKIERTEVHDFENDESSSNDEHVLGEEETDSVSVPKRKCLCIVKYATAELLARHHGLEISMTKTIAESFGLRSRTQVVLKLADFEDWTASHIELAFRDAYLSRSDMWRLVSQELADKVVYKGQKVSFLGSMKLTVKEIHVNGNRESTGFFAGTTIPVFRSEAARYVLFIQMSREMWDFDSEGNGEIMFNRVVNGFLPDLFRRWALLEVRHLVSIVMFGRLEYNSYDFSDSHPTNGTGRISESSSISASTEGFYQDFYRVVVTDMASAQWTTILNELKKDFRVFLRDISLHTPVTIPIKNNARTMPPKITGRPSTALKGNILEAINIASSQFANDYIDRDLIRTGVSTVVITAGGGVFDVDRDLLNLTSENLTNNGIGIDIVCLSKMPLHSVPLFRYRLPESTALSRAQSHLSSGSRGLSSSHNYQHMSSIDHSSALSSFTGTSATYFSRFPSAFPSKLPQPYGYGIPQWIDLSYWSHPSDQRIVTTRGNNLKRQNNGNSVSVRQFVPRVRMYELQMMGLMELGMADISIPYIAETNRRQKHSRRTLKSDGSNLSSIGNLSQSPTYHRRGNLLLPRQRDGVGLLGSKIKSSGMTFELMDDYDCSLFDELTNTRKVVKKSPKKPDSTKRPLRAEAAYPGRSPSGQQQARSLDKNSFAKNPSSPKGSEKSVIGKLPETQSKSKTPRISRSISYALRGLTPSLRSSLVSDARLENIKAPASIATTNLASASATTPSQSTRSDSLRSYDVVDHDTRSVISVETTATENPSKPISITASGPRPVSQQVSHKLEMSSRSKAQSSGQQRENPIPWTSRSSSSSEDEKTNALRTLEALPSSIPSSTLPFVRNVNASNPLKRPPRTASAFGRWQHLYPHKPHNATVKWRSLCTPASVPLTTDDFPTTEELSREYDAKEHTIDLRQTTDVPEVPVTLDSLLFEMISLRLSHGYQVIIGDSVKEAVGDRLCESSAFLDSSQLSRYGSLLFLCMGNTIQKLSFMNQDSVHVTKYVKKEIETEYPYPPLINYSPNIRTILAGDYAIRNMELRGFSEEYPWEAADNYLADGQVDSINKVNTLRFWRARFVLLPVEPPVTAWKPQHTLSEENEEEIHLLGIRSLTQTWQKARYVAPSERAPGSIRINNNRKKDRNPLEIKYETLNPSEIVALELDRSLALEEAGEIPSTQLLPESEKLDRNTSMMKISQAMQGEKGIDIRNRRWHLRLHYNCFHGEEFTNWLLNNVRNMETRDEAVEFGNTLMQEGLFEHVNGRHQFKDGHYFYSLRSEFKAPRIDIKASWFPGTRRPEKSVPPTPLSDHPSRETPPPMTTRSRSGSHLMFAMNPTSSLDTIKPPFAEKQRKLVNLTKMIRIDVDPRRRSSRPEHVDLHYDRFHNPENCYHIELSWLNTTSKLVDDAIVSWTLQAEKFGLKLVEVPIAEACRVPEAEPFRKAYRVKLALNPPKRFAPGQIMTPNSFTPQSHTNTERHIYHRAILRRFNFVLDIEAKSEFPENVDVQYSAAGLEYKYTQYVHRSGIALAQITEEGDFLLLSNRLYNSRLTGSKEGSNSKFDNKKEPVAGPGFSHRPPPSSQSNLSSSVQASGIIGPNMLSPKLMSVTPFSPYLSPLPRATSDVFGLSRFGTSAYSTSSATSNQAVSNNVANQYITPEQIKDELEQFCSDSAKLEQFYKEVNVPVSSSAGPAHIPILSNQPGISVGPPGRKVTAGSGVDTSSGALQPIQDTNEGIPEFVLPESITTTPTSSFSNGGSGFTLGLSGLMSRRARVSIVHENATSMLNRAVATSNANINVIPPTPALMHDAAFPTDRARNEPSGLSELSTSTSDDDGNKSGNTDTSTRGGDSLPAISISDKDDSNSSMKRDNESLVDLNTTPAIGGESSIHNVSDEPELHVNVDTAEGQTIQRGLWDSMEQPIGQPSSEADSPT